MPSDPVTGFFGKMPARGDFLRVGLPRSFTDPLDDWLSRALTAARADLGERWEAVWSAASTWRFVLPPGACGPAQAVGVLLPSEDRVGRAFPLVIARLGPASDPEDARFLTGAERAGREAISHALSPDALQELLTPVADADAPPPLLPSPVALWWTTNGRRLALPAFPDPEAFAAMLLPGTEEP